jgi:hypothetical protein
MLVNGALVKMSFTVQSPKYPKLVPLDTNDETNTGSSVEIMITVFVSHLSPLSSLHLLALPTFLTTHTLEEEEEEMAEDKGLNTSSIDMEAESGVWGADATGGSKKKTNRAGNGDRDPIINLQSKELVQT